MILISIGLSFALLLIVHNFLILIPLLLLGIVSKEGLVHFLTGRGYKCILASPEKALKDVFLFHMSTGAT